MSDKELVRSNKGGIRLILLLAYSDQIWSGPEWSHLVVHFTIIRDRSSTMRDTYFFFFWQGSISPQFSNLRHYNKNLSLNYSKSALDKINQQEYCFSFQYLSHFISNHRKDLLTFEVKYFQWKSFTRISGTFVRVTSFPATPSRVKFGPSQCCFT